ncbi:MAG: hypothetical protein ACRCSV_00295 [Chlamydiales bacterium]
MQPVTSRTATIQLYVDDNTSNKVNVYQLHSIADISMVEPQKVSGGSLCTQINFGKGHYFVTMSLRTDIAGEINGEFHFSVSDGTNDGTIVVPKDFTGQRISNVHTIQAIICCKNGTKLSLINTNSVNYVIKVGELLIVKIPYCGV